jgi:hypothetical protein
MTPACGNMYGDMMLIYHCVILQEHQMDQMVSPEREKLLVSISENIDKIL